MADEPRKHITEAIGGQAVEPLTHEQREEQERVRHLIRAVLACYNSLVSEETDESRRTELEAQRAVHTERFRDRLTLSDAERREILDTYPDLLVRLRAELDG